MKPQSNYALRVKYGACAPTQDLNLCVSSTPTTTYQVQRHTHFGSFSLCETQSRECTDNAPQNTGVHSHPRPRLLSAHNPYDDKMSTVPHTRFGGFSHSVKPPSKESVDKARAKYSATHLLQQIFSLCKTPVQRIHRQGLGEIQACMQPLKTLTLDYSQPIQ
ncbi:hypothetical protein BS47DRAFT_1365593 [Hydnum rufescens UP504]|uniref:Uncharacterized protein n=1 Tax=Hydnum rufescens UP504 TaxID=1448309 RepID=A0A9P6ANJ0_9AGAM|nr:hypothetical protein BS47DRAFT_1365593 [Hydnum rufescens UP504]